MSSEPDSLLRRTIPVAKNETCLKRPLNIQKLAFKTDYRLMLVKSIAECCKRAFCITLDLHQIIMLPFVINIFVCLFLSARLRQV